MGWLNPAERKAVRKQYKVNAYYMCDHCHLPILEAPLIGPNTKYHPKPDNIFSTREPKTTYHVKPCGLELFSKSGRKQKFNDDVVRAADRILHRLKKRKPRGYWTKEKLTRYYQKKLDKKIFKKAMSLLRKEKKIRKRKGGYCAHTRR